MTTPTDTAGLREMLAKQSKSLLLSYRKKDGLTCYVYDENRLKDERYMREALEETFAPALTALLDEIDTLRACVEDLEGALKPFAAIVPSSLYPADGSENEGYCVLLAPMSGNPVEYTGKDLARARTTLQGTKP